MLFPQWTKHRTFRQHHAIAVSRVDNINVQLLEADDCRSTFDDMDEGPCDDIDLYTCNVAALDDHVFVTFTDHHVWSDDTSSDSDLRSCKFTFAEMSKIREEARSHNEST